MSNILKRANEIVNERSEEKERQYGPMKETHERTAMIASLLSGKEISTKDIYWMKIAMKLARESYSHKEDNLLDVCAYIAGLNDYLEENESDNIITQIILEQNNDIRNILTKENIGLQD